MQCLIPNKNKTFENEKIFLEEKYRQGFKLKKRGALFYQFVPVDPEEAVYEIDLAPKSLTDDEVHVTGWEVIETKRILYKNLKKVYYINEDPENRLLIDERLRLDYYKREVFLWNFICSLPFLIIFTILLTQVPLASPRLTALIPFLLFPSIPLIIFSIRKCLPFNQGIRFLREKLGEEVEFPVFYLISFLNPTPEQKKELDENFTAIGSVISHTQRENHAYYYLKSLINHIPELKQELLNITTIHEENIKISRQAGVYSMPLVASGWDSE